MVSRAWRGSTHFSHIETWVYRTPLTVWWSAHSFFCLPPHKNPLPIHTGTQRAHLCVQNKNNDTHTHTHTTELTRALACIWLWEKREKDDNTTIFIQLCPHYFCACDRKGWVDFKCSDGRLLHWLFSLSVLPLVYLQDPGWECNNSIPSAPWANRG